ncbi:MAG: hypothetical protein A4E64_00059 [Syntrophorhabdus sp. PtaU1.Bin058]|nr:MAG: hypothetical protein A4E64_00059 [Syntrophorhabdus sp. PtaU1.Bin058]
MGQAAGTSRTIYIDKRYFAGRKAKWVSFEDAPGLTETKRDIYGRCVPCITNLYEQLKEGRTEIDLGPAFRCWKVVVVLKSAEECVGLLAELENVLPDGVKVKGRFGSVDEGRTTKVVVFNVPDVSQRKRLSKALKDCSVRVCPDAEITFHRGCAELYHELFGNWKTWKKTAGIVRPEAVPVIIDRIRKTLFWEKKSRKE